jgi:hypothetical protein
MSNMSCRMVVPALVAIAVGAAIPVIGQTTAPAGAPATSTEAATATATAGAVHFAKQPAVVELCNLKKLEPKLTDAELTKYESDLVGRTKDFVSDLKLTDKEKEEHMKESVIAFYRAVRGWHDIHDAEYNKIKKDFKNKPVEFAKAKETFLPIHKAFVDDLASFLTAEQVWMVKDRLCYTRPTIMYKGFIEQVPGITEAQKAEMLACVKEVCEIAMDEGSSTDKHSMMDQYKGRLTNMVAKFKKANGTDSQPATGASTSPAPGTGMAPSTATGPASKPA